VVVLRYVLLVLLLLVAQTVYFNLGGAWAQYLAPQLLLLAAAFIGALFGPRVGLWAGVAIGILEELCFVSPQMSLGPTPFVYMWCAYAAGQLFGDRVDLESSTVWILLSWGSLLFAALAAGGWILILHKTPFYWGGLNLRTLISYPLQGFIVGPLLFQLFLRARKDPSHE